MRFFPYGKAAFSFLVLSLLSGTTIRWNALRTARPQLPPGTRKLTY